MAKPVEIKRRDTHDTIWTTNLDISSATLLRLLAKNTRTKVTTPLTAVPDTAFSVKHTLTGTLDPGEYEVELEATIAGRIITSPTSGYVKLIVWPDLA